MQLDLKDIINIPGGVVRFDYEPDLSGLETASVSEVLPGSRAVGSIENHAGVLEFNAEFTYSVINVCSRCLKEVNCSYTDSVHAVLIDEAEDSEDPECFNLTGNIADVDEIIENAFVLGAEEQFLCRPDCAGLCTRCGADLNEGPCGCRKEIDPRFAALAQLLENE